MRRSTNTLDTTVITRVCKAFSSSLVLVVLGLMLIAPANAQTRKAATKSEAKPSFKGEIADIDAFNADIRSKGAKPTLFGIYLQRIKTQIGEFEKGFVPLEYSSDSLQTIMNNIMQDNPNEVMANAIDLSQGMSFRYKKFATPKNKFNGKLSDTLEKAIFNAKWTSPNKGPLTLLKAQQPDFGPELEQILVNEANKEGLVETQLRNSIYSSVKKRLSGGLAYTLSDKDMLGAKIGMKLESYLLSNYQQALARKKIDELMNLVDVVAKY